MYAAMATLLDRLDAGFPGSENVIGWGCPVPYFGCMEKSRIATVGINPSSREFVDGSGRELTGTDRRLPTLRSLGLATWADAAWAQLRSIVGACSTYFEGNPYDRWFGVLDRLLEGTPASFYSPSEPASHLDLIPYATVDKWTNLLPRDRSALLSAGSDALGLVLRDSAIEVLILNGRSVVRHFEFLAGVELTERAMPAWRLPRQASGGVRGCAYFGTVDAYGDLALCRSIAVLGFNHNLQSSFGVTASVVHGIGEWISAEVEARLA